MVSGPDVVRTLYKSITSCSDHHTDDVLKRLHTPTPVDAAIVRAANDDKVVIVTGNPGDGKTHIIRRAGEKFPESLRKSGVREDANEIEDLEIVSAIATALNRGRGLMLAINEGILLELCERHRDQYSWAGEIADRILRPFTYGRSTRKSVNNRIVILDLNLRNCLGPTVAGAALDRILELAGDAESAGALADNVQRLRDATVRDRLLHLLDSIGRAGFHATMRELLGFLAFLLCGGEEEGRPPHHYAQNAFGDGQGTLFDRVRELDPAGMPAPFLDDQLWNCLDAPGEWVVVDPGEYRRPGDRDAFKQRKRRAYFEHLAGKSIVTLDQLAVEKEFARLRNRTQSPEQAAVRLTNSFFKPDASAESLVLWMYHQYSVRPIRHLVSRQAVRSSDLKVSVPELPSALAAAFPDYQPDHVVLHHKDMSTEDGLVIDRRLIQMLLDGSRATGMGTRNLEAQKKIAGFFDRLAPLATDDAVVSVLRVDTGLVNQIGVDLDAKSFFIPGGR
jgi:hypothetical protein